MGVKSTVWFLLFFTLIFRTMPASIKDKEGVGNPLESTMTRRSNIKRPNVGDTILPTLPLPSESLQEAKNQSRINPWNIFPVNRSMGVKNPMPNGRENTQDGRRRSEIKTPSIGAEKNSSENRLLGLQSPSGGKADSFRVNGSFVSDDPSSRTKEKVFQEDRPSVEKETLLMVKVETTFLNQPMVGKKPSNSTSQKHSQKVGHLGSRKTNRTTTPNPIPVTSKVNTPSGMSLGNPTTSFDDLVLLSLIDVPDREEEGTTCGPGERWHNDRCRPTIG